MPDKRTKPLVVAISGKMRSGKTWCSDRLIREHGANRMSFAAPLKDDIRGMGFPEKAIQEKPPWMRQLMQAYGQAWRAVDPDHWVKQLLADLRNGVRHSMAQIETPPVVVIDDMRFPNEARHLLLLEGAGFEVRLIRLERMGEQPPDASHTQEISELALDDWNDWWQVFRIEGGDLHGLARAADQMVRV